MITLRPGRLLPPAPLAVGRLGTGPLGHFLLDPGSLFFRAARLIPHLVLADGLAAGPALAAAAAVLLALREWLGRRRHAALCRDARQVAILAPPEVDPAGADALWLNLWFCT